MNLKDFKGLKEILKRKDRADARLLALDKFYDMPNKDRVHGLGLKTSVSFVNLDDLEIGFDKLKGYPTEVFTDQKVLFFEGEEIFNSNVKGLDKIKDAISNFVSSDKIDVLHEALNDVLLVYIPSGSEFDILMFDKVLSNNSFSHTIFYFGENSKANILYHVSNDKGFVGTEFLNIICDNNSDVFFGFVKDLTKDYYLHNKNNNYVYDNATLKFLSADFGGKLIVDDTVNKIVGVGASADIDNIFYGVLGEEFDVNGSSIHANKKTSSLITLKGVLESSKALTRGLVKIEENAPDSNGYQKSDIMLLDEKSHAISIPDLLIHNDQVKCSHGSTISHLEEEKVFYLQSRGLSKIEASRKLVEGFYFPVIERIPNEQIKEKVIEKIERRLYLK
jgi:Fe-S cluster assembly scaffold protein SufB